MGCSVQELMTQIEMQKVQIFKLKKELQDTQQNLIDTQQALMFSESLVQQINKQLDTLRAKVAG